MSKEKFFRFVFFFVFALLLVFFIKYPPETSLDGIDFGSSFRKYKEERRKDIIEKHNQEIIEEYNRKNKNDPKKIKQLIV